MDQATAPVTVHHGLGGLVGSLGGGLVLGAVAFTTFLIAVRSMERALELRALRLTA